MKIADRKFSVRDFLDMTSTSHQLAPDEKFLQLQIPVVLPGVEDEEDGCVQRLEAVLSSQTGIRGVHLDRNEIGKPVLCLHYAPNLVPMEKLERLVKDEGAAITGRFKHENLPVKGMDCASCAASIEHVVRKIEGVTKVNVNYPTQKLKVEYDSTLANRAAIIKAVSKLGYRVPSGTPIPLVVSGEVAHSHQGHDHEDYAHDEPERKRSWIARNPEISLAIFAGLLLAIGFFGEQFFGVSPQIALGFYLAACVVGGYDLARHTIPTVLSGRFDVELLMLLGAIGAGILGEWAEGAFLLFLFSFGHALEHFAMDSARNAINALGQLTPKIARIKTENGEIEVPVEQIQIGQIAIVRPGDRLPVDGTIVAGRSSLDQSPITGESVPVEKTIEDEVFAGSINGDGALEIAVTKLSNDTTIARVLKMVEEAQSQKAPSQTFADKFERIFVPTILVVVVLAAVVPPILNLLTWETAFLRAISTLVAASPCALALATPSAVLAGIARAAQNGVLIKGGVHLENLGTLRAIAFDKTGTLTRGKPEISDVLPASGVAENELLQIAASVESRSSHPLALAVVERAKKLGLSMPIAGELQTLKGRGVQAPIGENLIRVGNLKMMDEAQIAVPDELKNQMQKLGETGKPTMIVARDTQVLGVLALADQIRENSQSTLEKLREIGITTLVMLTGDNARVAAHIAPQAGVTEFRADLLPEHKVEAIKELLETHEQVAMIGDGVNDAPALANATVGIAMGAGGTDVALETADVALMGDDLSKLPFAVALSRQAKNIIRQNLWISLGVIAILVPSTLFGFARLGVAVVFHEGSTLVVVINALRLLRFKLK